MTGSTVTGESSDDFAASYGVAATGSLTITGDDKLTAIGGTASYNSVGVYAKGVSVEGALDAEGGASSYSYGVLDMGGGVAVEGTLTATGGTASGEASGSVGVWVPNVTENGILIAAGDTGAIFGTVKNAIIGIG